MIVRIISSTALVIPSRRGIDKSCAVQLLNALGNRDFRERLCAQLTPALVVDDLAMISVSVECEKLGDDAMFVTYPSHNACVAQMLVDQDVELSFELGLLSSVWRWHPR